MFERCPQRQYWHFDGQVQIVLLTRTEYERVHGIKHPNIRADQRSRIAQALLDFVNDPEFDICGNEDLEDMAVSFFEKVASNDWRINHFATPGILKTRYYEEIWNQR